MQQEKDKSSKPNIFQVKIDHCKPTLRVVFVFACVINLLMLVTPLYSLQVLDRVIGSGNVYTLAMLSAVIAFIYFIYAKLQIVRSFTLIKMGEWLDNELSPVIFSHSLSAAATRSGQSSSQLLRDFQNVKGFITSTGINTIFDAPWSLVFLVVLFLIHPYIGVITIIGAILVLGFAFFNAIATNKTLGESTEQNIKGMAQADVANRNAEAVEAMGMIGNVTSVWAKFNTAALDKQSVASYRNGILSNFSRFFRNLVTMAVTGTGAYVVVSSNGQDMTTGGMIASSIIVGRALAPFDNAIVMWKSISSSMKSYKNLIEVFSNFEPRDQGMPISKVDGNIAVENLYYATPNRNPGMNMMPNYILKGVSFSLAPGEILAIIGPSGAGKSTLAKILVGVWKASSGSVRLDGGDVYTWNRKNFGTHSGYLPQGIELFSGSIKQNIARMDENANPEMVVDAAKMCGGHDMILQFTNGYDTDIGSGGSNLSGGQKQRIGLARSFYGTPKFIVLDEPNANLDEAGEIALANALKEAKSRGITVIVISHRPSILSAVDKVLVLQDGAVASFGTKDEVQSRIKMLKNGTIHINE